VLANNVSQSNGFFLNIAKQVTAKIVATLQGSERFFQSSYKPLTKA